MIFFLFIAAILVIFSSYQVMLIFSFAVYYLIYKLFWREGEPKAIFAGLTLFWLSITIKIFYADLTGKSFEGLSISPNILNVAYLAMGALLIFALAINLVTSQINKQDILQRDNAIDFTKYNLKRVMLLYILSIVVKTVLGNIMFAVGGLSQVVNAMITLRDGVIFILLYIYYKQTNSFKIPMLLICIEILLSLFSYFSNFKDLIILFVVCFTFFELKFNRKQIATIVAISGICLYMLLIWQAVKGQYRNFLSGGERSSTVVVDRNIALSRFFELALTANLNNAELWYESIDRLSYIEFFAQATDNVPDNIPYENGKIWEQNITHVLLPRFLNPGKKEINDSEMVNRYATTKVAGVDQGTSFSLGFLAESYIDFGYMLMFIPVFLLGLLFGYIYRFVLLSSLNHMWGAAFVAPMWIFFNCNGTPGAKILGWLIMYILVYYIVNRFIIRRIDDFLKN